jgi:hypothetical protein
VFVDLRGSTIFTGDRLMALFGLNAKDPAIGVAGDLCGAREMLARVAQLNSRLRGRLAESKSAFISARPLSAQTVEFYTLKTLADLRVIRHTAGRMRTRPRGDNPSVNILLVPIRC